MQFICDAPGGKAWFRIETEAEAIAEAAAMRHAVDQYFIRAREQARALYRPADVKGIERDIGLNAHIARTTPMFLTLRSNEGDALATAMLPPNGGPDAQFHIIVVGHNNADPYPRHSPAIAALSAHYGLNLAREHCYPYA